jgi:hypothetical protein
MRVGRKLFALVMAFAVPLVAPAVAQPVTDVPRVVQGQCQRNATSGRMGCSIVILGSGPNRGSASLVFVLDAGGAITSGTIVDGAGTIARSASVQVAANQQFVTDACVNNSCVLARSVLSDLISQMRTERTITFTTVQGKFTATYLGFVDVERVMAEAAREYLR